MLRTNLATRRTFVRLRVTKNKAEALFLLGLSVLHLFSYPLKRVVKALVFYLFLPLKSASILLFQPEPIGLLSRIQLIVSLTTS